MRSVCFDLRKCSEWVAIRDGVFDEPLLCGIFVAIHIGNRAKVQQKNFFLTVITNNNNNRRKVLIFIQISTFPCPAAWLQDRLFDCRLVSSDVCHFIRKKKDSKQNKTIMNCYYYYYSFEWQCAIRPKQNNALLLLLLASSDQDKPLKATQSDHMKEKQSEYRYIQTYTHHVLI